MAVLSQGPIALLLPDLGGGGAERVAVTLANAFARRGHRVEVVLMRAEGLLFPLLDPSVIVINLKTARIRDVPRRLAIYLRHHRPRAVLALMWPLTVAAVVARRLARSPARLVLSDHSTLGRQYPGWRARLLVGWTMRLLYPRAQACTTVSFGAAEDMAALSGLPPECFEILSNPLELPPLPLPRLEAVEALWGGEGRRILSLGSLKAEKNHALLLRAFAALPLGNRLMIVGEGVERARIEILAADLGIAERVILPGFRIDPWPFLASADLFVLSSQFEGLPLVLVEALHAGLKIVSTDCPSGPREILQGGTHGRLVPTGNVQALSAAMHEALHEQPDFEGLTKRAQQLAGHETVDRYLELLVG